MGRSPCCDESGLKKGPWIPEEDESSSNTSKRMAMAAGEPSLNLLGLTDVARAAGLRWTNYLRPDKKRGKFSPEQTILHLHSTLGDKWSASSTHLPGRTDNEIKNFWNTHLKKKLIHMGIDLVTHRPSMDLLATLPQLMALASLREIVEHLPCDEHAARLQAEAVRLAKLQRLCYLLQSPTSTTSSTETNTSNLSSSTSNMALMSSLYTQIPAISISIPSGLLPLPEMSCSFDQQPFGNDMKQDQRPTPLMVSPEENNEDELKAVLSSPSSLLLAEVVDDFLGNNGDNCNTSSYGGSLVPPYFWAEPILMILL